MVEHIVLMSAREERRSELEAALERFLAEIVVLDSVSEITAGPNFNEGGLGRGWTHAMIVRLDGPGDLRGYWDHDAHVRLVEVLDDTCSDRFAMDYEVSREEEVG